MTVVYFDGVCGLCDHLVDWLLALDVEHVLKFAPLQGETARHRLFAGGPTPTRLTSVVVTRGDEKFEKSDAIFVALSELGGSWHLVLWLRWIPRFLRDGVYDLIATNRYQMFGKKDVCRLPTPEEQEHFLP